MWSYLRLSSEGVVDGEGSLVVVHVRYDRISSHHPGTVRVATQTEAHVLRHKHPENSNQLVLLACTTDMVIESKGLEKLTQAQN